MNIELKIEVPQNWRGITLREYLRFQKDVEVYGEEESGYTSCLLHHFCKIPSEYIQRLDIDTYQSIKDDLVSFIGKTEHELQRFILIDGVEYGFEPNLSKIPYGAYLDITKYDSITIDENWSKIMSILYRKVVKKSGSLYSIEPYNGEIDGSKFLDITMDVHFGTLFFFINLLTELVNYTQNSLMVRKDSLQNTKKTSQESGKGTNPS